MGWVLQKIIQESLSFQGLGSAEVVLGDHSFGKDLRIKQKRAESFALSAFFV